MNRAIRFTTLGVAILAVASGILVYHKHSLSSSSSDAWVAVATQHAKQAQAASGAPSGHPASSKPDTSSKTKASNAEQRTSSRTSTVAPGSRAATTVGKTSGTNVPTPAKKLLSSGSGSTTPQKSTVSRSQTTSLRSTTTTGRAAGGSSTANSVSVDTGKSKTEAPSTGNATPSTSASLGTFTISLSEDNGQKQLAERSVPIVQGESLMQYMHQLFTVQTTDGDDFVVGINGIMSQWTGVPVSQRQPVDWILYVNGHQAPVGAADIYPHAGDVDLWDYHRWNPSGGN